jgi:membrane protein implicated in regulation of membrane protease activity
MWLSKINRIWSVVVWLLLLATSLFFVFQGLSIIADGIVAGSTWIGFLVIMLSYAAILFIIDKLRERFDKKEQEEEQQHNSQSNHRKGDRIGEDINGDRRYHQMPKGFYDDIDRWWLD